MTSRLTLSRHNHFIRVYHIRFHSVPYTFPYACVTLTNCMLVAINRFCLHATLQQYILNHILVSVIEGNCQKSHSMESFKHVKNINLKKSVARLDLKR